MSQAAPLMLPGAVYDALRSRIIDQTEEPGSTVTESAVALRFGVARATAKIAIDRLVADGLLRREAHQAARVPVLTRDDIRDLFENRELVEGAALARLAVSGTIPAEALAAHRALPTAEGFAEHDIAFHRALVAGQPSARLARSHALLMGEIELAIGQVEAHRLRTAQDVVAQHEAILDAVIAGDPELAERLAREHVRRSAELLLDHYDQTHGEANHG